MKGQISVIVPVYNAEEYIEHCVESILNQTYENFELILVDDGSKDSSAAICGRLALKDSRVYVICKENGGVSSARNRGLEEAKGKYIAFVDADDYVDKDYLRILLNKLMEYNADIAICDYTEIINGEEVNHFHSMLPERIISHKSEYYRDFFSECDRADKDSYHATVWGKLINKNTIGNLRFDNLKFGEDTLFMMRLFSRNVKTILITYIGYYYVRWENSVTISAGILNPKRLMDQLVMIREIAEVCRNELTVWQSVAEKEYAHYVYSTISELVKNNNYKEYISNYKNLRNYICELLEYSYFNSMNIKHRVLLKVYLKAPNLYWLVIGSLLRLKGTIKLHNQELI